MATAGSPEDASDHAAEVIANAEFVRLVATADGDALAATGLLARGLEAAGVPFQATLDPIPKPPGTDADCTVTIGNSDGDVSIEASPLATEAAAVLRAFAPEAIDAELALCGAVCAGVEPAGWLLERAAIERQVGIAIPTEDRIEGLATSTLIHAAFSGDVEATEHVLSELESDTERGVASLVALASVEDAPPRASTAIERMLRPYGASRFETLGGFADVLDAVARVAPGTGLALSLDHDVEAAARDAWKVHGEQAHTALRAAEDGRYDGLYVVRIDGVSPAVLGTVARLAFWYRSPEPIALAVTDGAAAVVADREIDAPMVDSAAALDGQANIRNGSGTATFDGTPDDFTAAFRRAV